VKLTRGNGVDTDYAFDDATRLTDLDLSGFASSADDQTLDFEHNPAGQITVTCDCVDIRCHKYAWRMAHEKQKSFLGRTTKQPSVPFEDRRNFETVDCLPLEDSSATS